VQTCALPIATGEPVVLGVNLELTGPAAPYSVPAVEAFELFVEQKNAEGGVLDGRPLELVVLDNKTDTTEGVSLQTRLANDEDVLLSLDQTLLQLLMQQNL